MKDNVAPFSIIKGKTQVLTFTEHEHFPGYIYECKLEEGTNGNMSLPRTCINFPKEGGDDHIQLVGVQGRKDDAQNENNNCKDGGSPAIMSDQMQTKRKRKEHIIDGKGGRTQVAEEKPFDKKKKAKDKTASPPNKQKQKKAEQSESTEYDSSCSTIATSNTKRQSTQEKFGQSKTKPSYSTWKNNQSSQRKQCNVQTFPANATGEGDPHPQSWQGRCFRMDGNCAESYATMAFSAMSGIIRQIRTLSFELEPMR